MKMSFRETVWVLTLIGLSASLVDGDVCAGICLHDTKRYVIRMDAWPQRLGVIFKAINLDFGLLYEDPATMFPDKRRYRCHATDRRTLT